MAHAFLQKASLEAFHGVVDIDIRTETVYHIHKELVAQNFAIDQHAVTIENNAFVVFQVRKSFRVKISNLALFKIRISIQLMKRVFLFVFTAMVIGCGPKIFKTEWTKEIAPAEYSARFETSKGHFDVKVERRLSPKAADRFHQLVRHDYFDNMLFYRVVPGFVAQFGTSDSVALDNWLDTKIPDEKVVQGNRKGTLSFARAGVETRGTDLFINLGDNSRLDTISYNGVTGFPSFGKVVAGMQVLDSIYSGYGDRAMSDYELMQKDKEAFLKKYPKLDSIYSAYILK